MDGTEHGYWTDCAPAAPRPHRPAKTPGNEEPNLHVLFVCTGNICRSPTAERLASAYAAEHGIGLVAASAGTRAVIGHPVHPSAEEVLRTLGGDASGFAARQLTPKVTKSVDLILTMTTAHRDRVLEIAPSQLRRTFTLTEAALLATDFGAETVADLPDLRPHLAARPVPDIADPIGQNLDVFTTVGRQIADLLPPVVELCRPR